MPCRLVIQRILINNSVVLIWQNMLVNKSTIDRVIKYRNIHALSNSRIHTKFLCENGRPEIRNPLFPFIPIRFYNSLHTDQKRIELFILPKKIQKKEKTNTKIKTTANNFNQYECVQRLWVHRAWKLGFWVPSHRLIEKLRKTSCRYCIYRTSMPYTIFIMDRIFINICAVKKSVIASLIVLENHTPNLNKQTNIHASIYTKRKKNQTKNSSH